MGKPVLLKPGTLIKVASAPPSGDKQNKSIQELQKLEVSPKNKIVSLLKKKVDLQQVRRKDEDHQIEEKRRRLKEQARLEKEKREAQEAKRRQEEEERQRKKEEAEKALKVQR